MSQKLTSHGRAKHRALCDVVGLGGGCGTRLAFEWDGDPRGGAAPLGQYVIVTIHLSQLLLIPMWRV